MLRNIIFDLNGVFIKSRKLSERFEEAFGVPEELFLSALREIMAQVRLPGAGDMFEYWRPYFDTWNVNLTREEFLNFWFEGEKEAPEMIALAEDMKSKGINIYILSNNFRERTDYYNKHFSFLKEVPEKVYYSWQTGHTKNSPEAYKTVLEENHIDPAECMFFDDSEENVKVAESLGIRSFLFQSPEETKRTLEGS